MTYGLASSIANDPIEKKPLYHFYPGSYVLSFGTYGCNLRCRHCQNYDISQTAPGDESGFRALFTKTLTSQEPTELARKRGSSGLAWTYNEPTVWFEFNYDASKIAKEHGLYTVYVTNGYINAEPLRKLAPYLDAMNIDIKAITDKFYREVSRAKLQPVLDTAILAKELGIHVETTYLIIPGYNDSVTEFRKFCKWVVENLGKSTPTHFSRFHPDYQMRDVPATPVETMATAYKIAQESGLEFPFLGNIYYENTGNTFCPHCNKLLIERSWMSTEKNFVKAIKTGGGECTYCGYTIYGRFSTHGA
jgi:pyruvate formate lyase activating enzyme